MVINIVRLETTGSLQERFLEFFQDLKEEVKEETEEETETKEEKEEIEEEGAQPQRNSERTKVLTPRKEQVTYVPVTYVPKPP